MNCTICSKPITLIPGAAERARKFGGKPEDYTNRFKEHSQCVIDKRNKETSELIARTAMNKERFVTIPI